MEGDYDINTDRSLLDVDFVHTYLSQESYWARGRTKELVEKSIAHSLCFGLYKGERQIGFGRVVTDFVVFAWLMDLFVDPHFRGKGLGTMLVQSIVDHLDLQQVNGIGLRTEDAHELYRKFGFEKIPKAETWLFRKKK